MAIAHPAKTSPSDHDFRIPPLIYQSSPSESQVISFLSVSYPFLSIIVFD
jgi:hypothetical protein